MRSLLGTLLAAAFLALALAFLTGCETLRVGFTTDFGTFSYELPKPRPGK
ncbi:MAG: hypothetical protein KGR46_07495 [Verrucomicrobia bacterium]|nr:hypothetical protein [Verrucomicrobiota bacterium]